jgi:hypothetical protein
MASKLIFSHTRRPLQDVVVDLTQEFVYATAKKFDENIVAGKFKSKTSQKLEVARKLRVAFVPPKLPAIYPVYDNSKVENRFNGVWKKKIPIELKRRFPMLVLGDSPITSAAVYAATRGYNGLPGAIAGESDHYAPLGPDKWSVERLLDRKEVVIRMESTGPFRYLDLNDPETIWRLFEEIEPEYNHYANFILSEAGILLPSYESPDEFMQKAILGEDYLISQIIGNTALSHNISLMHSSAQAKNIPSKDYHQGSSNVVLSPETARMFRILNKAWYNENGQLRTTDDLTQLIMSGKI